MNSKTLSTNNLWGKALVLWFKQIQREMPWRNIPPNPYHVWVSEIMLQQTQVDTVIPYFNRFIEHFPTLQILAEAPLELVLKQWEGLGYYARARNLHKAALQVCQTLFGKIPTTYIDLQKLPGLGPYCSAAIASIAFQEPVPVVDGNVLRVFSRFWCIELDIRLPKTRQLIFDQLTPIIQEFKPSDFNQGIMELGALVCKPKNPKCKQCPLQSDCKAYQSQQVDAFPIKGKAAPVPHHTIVVGLIWRNKTLLIAKRKVTQMLGGLWEFPGGKCKDTESLEEALKREIKEETTLEIENIIPFCTVEHAYTHFKITMHAFSCESKKGRAKAKTSDMIEWVSIESLEKKPFPRANQKIIERLLSLQ